MKILAALPLCGVDLPNAFLLSGASIYIQTRKRQDEREREREMKEGKITKNYSLERRRAERQEPQKGREF